MMHLTKAEYLEELNRRLKQHPDYHQGMRFLPVSPDLIPQASPGIAWEPADLDHPFWAIAEAMKEDYYIT
jgi:hypothetical protein